MQTARKVIPMNTAPDARAWGESLALAPIVRPVPQKPVPAHLKLTPMR